MDVANDSVELYMLSLEFKLYVNITLVILTTTMATREVENGDLAVSINGTDRR